MAGETDTLLVPTGDAVDSPDAGRRFVRGGSLRVLAYGGAILFSVGVMPFVTHELGPPRYGQLGTVAALILIVTIMTEGGLGTVGIREYSNLTGEARAVFMRHLLGLRLALSLLGAIGAVVFALAVSYPAVEVEGTAIAGLGLLLVNVQVTLAIPLTAELRIGWIAAIDLIGPGTGALALVAFVLTHAPLLWYFAAPALSVTLTLAVTVWLVRGETPVWPSVAPARWRSLLRTTVLYAAATALGTVYFRVVVVAMSLLTPHADRPAGQHTVGVFVLAFRSLDVLSNLPWLLVISAWPILVRAARDDRERLRYAINRLIEGNLLLGGWVSLLLVCAGPFAARVLGHGDFAGSGEVMRILGAGIGFTFLVALFAFAMLSLQMLRTLIVINAAILALSILLCVLVIPTGGATGAAYVTVSLEVTLSLTYAATLFTHHPELRPALARAGRILLALAIAFAAALAAPVSSLASAAVGTAVLAVAVVVLRAAPPELLDAARSRR